MQFSSNISTINLIGNCLVANELNDAAFTNLTENLSSKKHDWEKFCHTAGSYWLLPYLHHVLESANLKKLAPEQVQTEILVVSQLAEKRNQRIKLQLEQVINTLNQNNIQPLLLKGASYLMRPFSEIQKFRMISDIDLFIPESSLHSTIEALIREGYQFSNFLPDGTDYHLDPILKKDMPARVELHLQPLATSASTLINAENAWENAKRIEQNKLSYFIFKPEFRIIHQFAHAQLHSRDYANVRLDLRQLFDFHLMCRTYDKDIDWDIIEKNFSTHQKIIWMDYVSMANLVFSNLDRPIASTSMEQHFRSQKMLAKLDNDLTRYNIYHWLERFVRLPLRLRSVNWYRNKFNYLLKKF